MLFAEIMVEDMEGSKKRWRKDGFVEVVKNCEATRELIIN